MTTRTGTSGNKVPCIGTNTTCCKTNRKTFFIQSNLYNGHDFPSWSTLHTFTLIETCLKRSPLNNSKGQQNASLTRKVASPQRPHKQQNVRNTAYLLSTGRQDLFHFLPGAVKEVIQVNLNVDS